MRSNLRPDIFLWSACVSKVSDNCRGHCALGGENRRVPWIEETQVSRPGRSMKGKLLENNGIPSSDLLQVFHLNQNWECWGHQLREWKTEAHALWTLHKEHPVWLWLRPSKPNWKPTYVNEVVIDPSLSAPPPRGCIEHKVAKHLMTDGDSADCVYV